MSDPVRQWPDGEDRAIGGGEKGERPNDWTRHAQGSAGATIKQQVGDVAMEATSVAAALAQDAQHRLRGLAEQQKAAGADRVADVARAVQAAAADLQRSSPHLAGLVKAAAERVDQFAARVRSSDLSDVIASVSALGRRKPLVLFGGAVAAGFLLTRFLKSDSPQS